MNFQEITESDYRSFWEHSPQKCYMSAPEISKLMAHAKVFYLGVKREGHLVAAGMFRGTKRRLLGYDFYAPRGPLLDYNDATLLEFFIRHCHDFLHHAGGYRLRIDPNLPLLERDIDGLPVENGWDNQPIVDHLTSLGFRPRPYVENVSQITWEFVLPVAGQTKEKLLEQMKPNTRRRIKQALELGIEIRDLDYDHLDSFYQVLADTGSRKSFEIRDLDYFQRMYQLFNPMGGIEFVSAVFNPKKSLAKLNDKLTQLQATTPDTIEAKRLQAGSIKSLETRIAKLTGLFPEPTDTEITLSSGMFMTIQPEILHLFGGNVGAYLKLDAQYALQWEMICRALSGGFQRYNFYGIPPDISTHPENYGIYEFKRGFSGYVEQLIGEFELPLSSRYHLSHIRK